jgi:hypothetical protein
MKYYGIKHKTYGLLGIDDQDPQGRPDHLRITMASDIPWLIPCKVTAEQVRKCDLPWNGKFYIENPKHRFKPEELEVVEVELTEL